LLYNKQMNLDKDFKNAYIVPTSRAKGTFYSESYKKGGENRK